jgi:hypothetical protein
MYADEAAKSVDAYLRTLYISIGVRLENIRKKKKRVL